MFDPAQVKSNRTLRQGLELIGASNAIAHERAALSQRLELGDPDASDEELLKLLREHRRELNTLNRLEDAVNLATTVKENVVGDKE